jgi:mono/diheme cytochrome c family protein
MIRYWLNALFVFTLSVTPALAKNGSMIDTPRGAMLYENHCIQCHTQQVHWRDKKLATDWESLIKQVDRWQHNAGLRLNENDIEEVSKYLNRNYYHFP